MNIKNTHTHTDRPRSASYHAVTAATILVLLAAAMSLFISCTPGSQEMNLEAISSYERPPVAASPTPNQGPSEVVSNFMDLIKNGEVADAQALSFRPKLKKAAKDDEKTRSRTPASGNTLYYDNNDLASYFSRENFILLKIGPSRPADDSVAVDGLVSRDDLVQVPVRLGRTDVPQFKLDGTFILTKKNGTWQIADFK